MENMVNYEEKYMWDVSFYKNKKVLITGHTGFKGSWLSEILHYLGAEVTGYGLLPNTTPSLFEICNTNSKLNSIIGDIRDYKSLLEVFSKNEPELVIHMAAQPLVRESYEEPLYTYETNVMGTANVLECIRNTNSVKSFINVTTDKVYENQEKKDGYIETDRLNGYDPYSNSKSCSELVTRCYQQSFFSQREVGISTCRAGNVIGGGDFAKDRIIPDCVRAAKKKEKIVVRNPNSIRPYQHVLEPLFVYLMIAMEQYKDINKSGCYNVGPAQDNCLTTGELVDEFCKKWQDGLEWTNRSDDGPHETNLLFLNSDKLADTFKWMPKWKIEKAVEKVVEWEKAFQKNDEIERIMRNQIQEYLNIC